MKKITKTQLFSLLLTLSLCTRAAAADSMRVSFLNVGQDDATLITCGEHAMLIDAGGNDDVEPIINYIANKQGISYLDYVVGTHPHEDHIGGLDSVIKEFEIGEILLPDVTTDTDTFFDVLTAIDEKGMSITVPEPGEIYSLGDAQVEILGPVRDYGDNLNNWSISLKVTCGEVSYLFTGDAEAAAESDLLNAGTDLHADVFKVAHHGSDTSNSAAFLNAVSPKYGVISCGAGNSYGHPNPAALERLNAAGVKLFRTDLQGTIVSECTNGTISWNAEPIGAAEADTSTEITVHITNTGEKYHTGGCRYLKKSDIPISLSDAKAQGYDPCSVCNPPR